MGHRVPCALQAHLLTLDDRFRELADVAHAASEQLVATVAAAQQRNALPAGDPERLTALLRAIAHGAADLALAGYLSPDGKGHTNASGLVDDLLGHLA